VRADVAPVDYGSDIIITCQQHAAYIGTATVSIGDILVYIDEYIKQYTNN